MTELANWKAFVDGVYAGLSEWKGVEPPEKIGTLGVLHYFKVGYIFGTFVRLSAIVLTTSAVTQVIIT